MPVRTRLKDRESFLFLLDTTYVCPAGLLRLTVHEVALVEFHEIVKGWILPLPSLVVVSRDCVRVTVGAWADVDVAPETVTVADLRFCNDVPDLRYIAYVPGAV